MKQALIFWAATLLLLGASGSADAQGIQTGTLRGTVRDQQGAVVPGVTVVVTSSALQGQRSVTTTEAGTFTLQALPPGDYQVRYDKQGFEPATRSIGVPLGGVAEQDITLQVSGITLTMTVAAPIPTPLAIPTVGQNLRQPEVEALATPRDLAGIGQLAPGVNENAPNLGQIVINGAFAFDNSFLLNGVDVNDNVSGTPQSLFIEDAIQETQTLTSGISAEYGRFTGGVVNAITKNGGNRFSGSLRLNLTNPTWTTETPFEKENAVTHEGNLNQAWEGTVGGPILTDRLWFFGAGRVANTSISGSLPQTNIPHTEDDRNRRGEIKVTSTMASNHTLQVGYVNNHTERDRLAAFPFTIDPAALVNRVDPNWYAIANYRGTLRNNLLAEAQYSEQRLSFLHSGGTSTLAVDSPIETLTQQLAQYNAPYFDASDPESRNNRQGTGRLTYFPDAAGRHQIKGGYEWFRTQRIGGNSPSATGYLFFADYATDASGTPLLDPAGRLMPQFLPPLLVPQIVPRTFAVHALPQPGATLNIDTNSVFAQDHWAISSRFSADVGARFEHVASVALPAEVKGVTTNRIAPRLAGTYDVNGNGDHVVHATYGWYAGRYSPRLIGANSNVANPDALVGVYLGPPGQGRSFAPGFDPANYVTVAGQFPALTNSFDPDLRSPVVREFTASYGLKLPTAGGYAEATYVHRRTADIIEDFITTANGVTTVVRNGVNLGTFTNVVWKNTDLAHRDYDGIVLQAQQALSPRWTLRGHYTLQLKNDGNYEGEAPNQPGITSPIGDYPEAFTAAHSYPDGHLQDFQRHRLRVWTVYDFGIGALGNMSVSGLWRVDSGRVYSLAALNEPLSDIQMAKLAAYPDPPPTQTIYFDDRGSQFFDGAGLIDVSVNYTVPIFKSLGPYVKADICNLFNNQKTIAFDTTIMSDREGPKDSLGLPTGYIKTPGFGHPDDNRDFPVPYSGLTGGRSFRLAIGFRF
jgi:hypothetical protein